MPESAGTARASLVGFGFAVGWAEAEAEADAFGVAEDATESGAFADAW
ncbi:hypothetical protein [Streptomyces nanshensis]|nr:hypothetical protein [Streptomyces nanshensis]